MMSGRFAAPFPKAPLFDDLPVGLLWRLAAYGRVARFAPGEPLVQEGQPTEWLHVITAGSVALECADPATGTPIRLDELGPGDVVGERGILDKDVPISTARAITDVETYRLHHPAIAWSLLGIPEATPHFAARVQALVNAARGRKLILTDRAVRQRLQEPARGGSPDEPVVDGPADP